MESEIWLLHETDEWEQKKKRVEKGSQRIFNWKAFLFGIAVLLARKDYLIQKYEAYKHVLLSSAIMHYSLSSKIKLIKLVLLFQYDNHESLSPNKI